MGELRVVSVDDLVNTLTSIANVADDVVTRCSDPVEQRDALFQIKWQALDAIERAERGTS